MKTTIKMLCFALLTTGIFIFSSCSSPGERVARDLCRCYEREIARSGHPISWSREIERNVYRCFDRKLERRRRHIERNHGEGEVEFKNPRHQREFDEAMEKCYLVLILLAGEMQGSTIQQSGSAVIDHAQDAAQQQPRTAVAVPFIPGFGEE